MSLNNSLSEKVSRVTLCSQRTYVHDASAEMSINECVDDPTRYIVVHVDRSVAN